MAYIVNLVYKCMDIIPVIQNFVDSLFYKLCKLILLTFVFLIVLRAEFGCVSGDRYTLTMRG